MRPPPTARGREGACLLKRSGSAPHAEAWKARAIRWAARGQAVSERTTAWERRVSQPPLACSRTAPRRRAFVTSSATSSRGRQIGGVTTGNLLRGTRKVQRKERRKCLGGDVG